MFRGRSSLEKYLPPWTVTRQVWSDSLSAQHSGISTDVLLFSDIHLSMVHHHRIHKRGLPHIAFRRNYLSQLRALLPLPVVQPTAGVVSPDSSGSGWLPPGDSPEVVNRSPRTSIRTYRSSRFRILWPQRGQWFLIVDLRCCLSRWTLEVLTCRRVGFRQCQPVWMYFPPDVSCCPVGGTCLDNLSR